MLMPSFKSLLASVLLAGAAVAQTDGPYSLGLAPVGIEKGVLNTTLTCQVTAIGFLKLGNQQIGFGVSALLPGRVSIGQPFSLVASTRLIVPKGINSLAGIFGAKYYSGTVDSVVVNTPGAEPASTDVAANSPIPIPASPLNTKGISVLEVPGQGNSITVGPLTASEEGNVVISFGQITSSITTLDKNMKKTFITAKVVCPAQSRPLSLAAIAVGGTASTKAIVPKSDGSIPTIPPGQTAGVTGFNLQCSFAGLVDGPVRVSIGGVKVGTGTVRSGSTIALSQGQGNIILTSTLVGRIKAIITNAASTDLTLTTFNILAQNATPAKKNIIPDGGVEIKGVPVKTGAVAVVPEGAPGTTFPDITFKAGKSGSTALLSIGDAAGSATVRQSNGDEIITVDFTCAALSPAVPVFPFDIA